VTEPGVLEQEATETESRLAPPWNVIVHNDPITLMVYVTMVLRRLFGYAFPRAHALMMEVHTRGRAIVWTGARERAEIYVQKLHACQLLATMEAVDE
jgi:ATP-dependent Clp protease adaptor protein ClpS